MGFLGCACGLFVAEEKAERGGGGGGFRAWSSRSMCFCFALSQGLPVSKAGNFENLEMRILFSFFWFLYWVLDS